MLFHPIHFVYIQIEGIGPKRLHSYRKYLWQLNADGGGGSTALAPSLSRCLPSPSCYQQAQEQSWGRESERSLLTQQGTHNPWKTGSSPQSWLPLPLQLLQVILPRMQALPHQTILHREPRYVQHGRWSNAKPQQKNRNILTTLQVSP